MECNKEEAIRAKEIAEVKMENKDFISARKVIIKAQQLFPGLENISQMLLVCDVHSSADRKLFGNEMDWYGILQIEQTADEATIKKQYRKFALLLHPDKNMFAGAEAAFKLIGQAQMTLLDPQRRSAHDMKYRSFVSKPAAPYHPAKQETRCTSFGVQNNFRNNTTTPFSGVNLQPQKPQQAQKPQQTQQQAQPRFANGRETFWTICPFCNVKYQYYREIIHKMLRCRSCEKSFVAYDINTPGAPARPTLFKSAVPQHKDVPIQGSSRVEPGFKANISTENSRKESFPKNGCTYGDRVEKVARKRRKNQVSDSDNSDTGCSSSENSYIFRGEMNFGCSGEQYVRRSNRHKQNVSYKENLSDDDNVESPPKRAKGSGGSSCTTADDNECEPKEEVLNKQAGLDDYLGKWKDVKQNENVCLNESLPNGNKKTNLSKEKTGENGCKGSSEANNESELDSRSTQEPEVYAYPDPDFSDFDKDRKYECFAVGQIWAIYDTVDAMPRFYAQIRKIHSRSFKLQITWLEPDPDAAAEIEWVNEGLPCSSGVFKRGDNETTEDMPMFSHLVFWEKGTHRNTYKIYPRKGEIWGLFKKWDINWRSGSVSNRKYEYEFVEILSNFAEDVGTSVAYLDKVKGFVSLFCRTVKEGTNTSQIPPDELLRFSHRVPSFKMTGEERNDVPKGSFELDPASLSTNLEEIAVPEDFEGVHSSSHPKSTCLKSPTDKLQRVIDLEGSSSTFSAEYVKKTHLNPDGSSQNVAEDCSAPPASTIEATEIPDPEFNNFNVGRSVEMFCAGQIWAIYGDEDGLPKYYCQIEKIDLSPVVRLHIRRLAVQPLPEGTIQWHDKDMPISCGTFKIEKGEAKVYAATDCFSHELRSKVTVERNVYTIFPKKQEVWALYKNWNAKITLSDLENCEYIIVEVLEENDMGINVTVLERVTGFNSVFKPQIKGGSAVKLEIKHVEMLRFSHCIPAFKLTDESGGSLRGLWELDPAAMPVHFFA